MHLAAFFNSFPNAARKFLLAAFEVDWLSALSSSLQQGSSFLKLNDREAAH